jgi:hydroxypyruvate reductase
MVDAFMARHGARVRAMVVSRGGHPLPDAESFSAGAEALRLADVNRSRGETLVVLLSGGASAMLAAPAEGVTIEQKIAAARELLRSGLPIAEINAVRKRLSAIKGGKLAARAGRTIAFALSDVHAPIEDDPSVIGSGPTVADPPLPDAEFVLAGSRRDAMAGARRRAEALGYGVVVLEPPVLGDAARAAAALAAQISALARDRAVARCVISSGETTVKLHADVQGPSTGRGGRNQEFALAFAMAFDAAPYAFGSFGTDGVDGPTDAAGAIVDERTLPRARAKGLDAARALQAHDSYTFFDALDDLVRTGPTGTNVGDLQIFLTSGSSPSPRP